MHARLPQLLVCALLALPMPSSAQTSGGDTASADIARGLSPNVPDGFTLATAGDIQITRSLSQLRDPALQTVLGWVRHADVAVGNLEAAIVDSHHMTAYPGPTHDSMRSAGPPQIAKDLKQMGFAIVARANNHALDWGIEGMRETDRLLDEAGVVHAGTGQDRAQARAPVYLDTPSGRIAFVSFATTFEDTEPALAPLGLAPGRPGISVLRTSRIALVDRDSFEALKRIVDAQPKDAGDSGILPNELMLFGMRYRESDHFGFTYDVNAADREDILRAVREGKLSSDFLVVNVHAHDPGNWSDAPADFFPPLAHALIDAGADAVTAEGPHHLRGIEIYKGKPIFYSLGNFAIQFAPRELVAEDMYEKLDGDPQKLTDAELIQSRIGVHVEHEVWYQSVVAVSKYEKDRLSEIILHPVSLALHARIADRGLPHAATGAEARTILENLARLSKPFGTDIEIDGDEGIVHVSDH